MKRTPGELLMNAVWIVVGSALYALAFTWFYKPNEVAMGGVTGIAQLINALFPRLPIGIMIIAVNVPIFLVGWRVLGGYFLVSSLAAMALSSLFIDLLDAVAGFSPMSDKLLASIIGGAVLGLGLGIVFLQESTTGGSDIIAKLLQRKLAWIPMGKIVLVVDLAVILLVAAVFRQLESALYGVAAHYVSTVVLDKVLYGMNPSKVAYIISGKPEETAGAISDELHHSVTFLEGEGGWTGDKKKVILCAFHQREIVDVKRVVRRLDPAAFLIVTDAYDVLGEGFTPYGED